MPQVVWQLKWLGSLQYGFYDLYIVKCIGVSKLFYHFWQPFLLYSSRLVQEKLECTHDPLNQVLTTNNQILTFALQQAGRQQLIKKENL